MPLESTNEGFIRYANDDVASVITVYLSPPRPHLDEHDGIAGHAEFRKAVDDDAVQDGVGLDGLLAGACTRPPVSST
jgi:hypothetical protein